VQRSKTIGFVNKEVDEEEELSLLDKSMRSKFRPEFLNRIDVTIKFETLTPEHMKKILELQLSDIQYRILSSKMNLKKIFFVMEDKTKDWLIEKGFSEEYGARNLKRVISSKIEIPLSCVLSDERLQSGDVVLIKIVEDQEDLLFEKTKTNKMKKYNISMNI
jgi:ATP-dependent Clp protease ATP-binding subunit ClpA